VETVNICSCINTNTTTTTTTTTTTVLWPFFWDQLGEPVSEESFFWTLWF